MIELSLDDIKQEFQILKYYGMDHRDFEQYLKEQYVKVYDTNLNLTGYERK